MASLRNAIPRKAHKERSQPAERKHLGLLEKKKDYIERARDFQRKVGKIKDLKKKVLERNPDEFYFGMLSSKTKGGVHETQRKDGHDKMSHAEICLLKDQDLGYLGMKQSEDARKAARLQKDLHLLLDQPINKHTIFVASEDAAASFDPAKHFGTDKRLAGRAYNRPRKATLSGRGGESRKGGADSTDGGSAAAGLSSSSSSSSAAGDEAAAGPRASGNGGIVSGPTNMKALKKLMKQRERSYKELADRLARAEKLKRMVNRKAVEKMVMNSKGTKRKVKEAEGGQPAVYKWKRQRAK
jgi:U3 small nucleolar RNA-associated protein 11